MDIAPFIRELIVLNECVILRGVGGFETTYKHAILDKKRKIILPPSKNISFRPEWIKDNEVLENHLIESLEISRVKASEFIDDFVQRFYNDLKENGKVFLNGIGEFRFDSKNNLVFTEIEDENYLVESFGLDSLDVGNGTKKEEKGREIELTPVIQQKRKLTGWYIAIGILLLLISVTTILFVSTNKGISLVHWSDNVSSDTKQEVVVFGNAEKAWEDSIISSIEKSLNDRTITKKALAMPQVQEIRPKTMVQSSAPTYYLVAGSFKYRKNADILEDQLIRKGFKPEIMITAENFYRVIVGAFSDRKEAIAELRRIRGQMNQSVWLLEEKPIN